MVWVLHRDDSELITVDDATNTVARRFSLNFAPVRAAVEPDGIWVVENGNDPAVHRIDAMSGRTTDTVPVRANPSDLVLAEGAVWVTNKYDAGGTPFGTEGLSAVTKVSRSTKEVSALIDLRFGFYPERIVAGAGSIWVIGADDKVARIDAMK
jgi:hypothetical protein